MYIYICVYIFLCCLAKVRSCRLTANKNFTAREKERLQKSAGKLKRCAALQVFDSARTHRERHTDTYTHTHSDIPPPFYTLPSPLDY